MSENLKIKVYDWFQDEIQYGGRGTIIVRHPSTSETISIEACCGLSFSSSGTNELVLNKGDSDKLFLRPKPAKSACEDIEIELEIKTNEGTIKGTGITQFMSKLFRSGEPQSLSIDWDTTEISFDTETSASSYKPIYFSAPITNLREKNMICQGNPELNFLLLPNQMWYLKYENTDYLFFIQPLKDKNGYLRQPKKGNSFATALLTGEIRNNAIEVIINITLNIKLLLSLASGRRCGIPWLEFRDDNGNLLKRIHFKDQYFAYNNIFSYIIDNHSINHNLLKCIHHIRNDNLEFFKSLIENVLFANDFSIPIKYRLTRLMISFEELFDFKGWQKPLKREKIFDNLENKQLENINKNIKNCLNQISKRTKGNNKKKYLNKLINGINENFGQLYIYLKENLEKIKEEYQFEDELILNDYFKNSPVKNHENKNVNSWVNIIRDLRNSLVHRNSFGYIEDTILITKIERHLRDLLIRLILKELKYDGDYIPQFGGFQPQSIDWVKKIQPKDLGF